MPTRSSIGLIFLVAGCSSGASMPMPDLAPACMHTVACSDQSIQQLPLFRPVNSATISNMSAGGVFTSSIDATAGGLTPTKSFVYAKLTDQGLTRVDVGDEDALSSLDWDLAFRRFIIRLNSGISGPSCVTAARTGTGTTFDATSSVPAGLDFRTEEYFTATCDFVPDGSGLGSPGVALQSFWEYPGCVKMTGNLFIVALADGRHAKLQVVDYYTPSVQMTCDSTGALPPGTPSGSGNFVIEWAFLP